MRPAISRHCEEWLKQLHGDAAQQRANTGDWTPKDTTNIIRWESGQRRQLVDHANGTVSQAEAAARRKAVPVS